MINKNKKLSIKYNGEVSFKYIINGKLVRSNTHNAGTKNLFKILTRALAGYDIRSDLPIKIDLQDSSNNNLLNHSAYLSGTRYYLGDDDNWSVYYTTTLQKSNMSAITVNDNEKYKLVLQSLKEDMATVDISSNLVQNILDGAQLIIDWRLFFTNIEPNEETTEESESSNTEEQ